MGLTKQSGKFTLSSHKPDDVSKFVCFTRVLETRIKHEVNGELPRQEGLHFY